MTAPGGVLPPTFGEIGSTEPINDEIQGYLNQVKKMMMISVKLS